MNGVIKLLPEKPAEDNARMTTEQLKELSEALSILSAKSSVLKERRELRALMEENLQAEEVRLPPPLCDYFAHFVTGSKVTIWRADEAYSINAHED
jgi:hypothetical protein